MPEAVGLVAGEAAHRAAAESVTALRAVEPVERGVDHPPVVAVGFGRHHLGERRLLVMGDVPAAQEGGPFVCHDAVDHNAPWFTPTSAATGVKFTTTNTSYPRSELRETTIPVQFTTGYFKAGVYTQANCGNSSPCDTSNYGETTLYNVSVKHS